MLFSVSSQTKRYTLVGGKINILIDGELVKEPNFGQDLEFINGRDVVTVRQRKEYEIWQSKREEVHEMVISVPDANTKIEKIIFY